MSSDLNFWLTALVVVITILLWASARLPEYVTAGLSMVSAARLCLISLPENAYASQ